MTSFSQPSCMTKIRLHRTPLSSSILIPILVSLINASFSLGIFPDDLKIAKVIPLFKKGDTLDINNYRPISLLTCFPKIFEKAS